MMPGFKNEDERGVIFGKLISPWICSRSSETELEVNRFLPIEKSRSFLEKETSLISKRWYQDC